MLLQRPGFDRARVELARAYFLQEEDLKAKEQFEIVLAHNPPPSVVDRVERFLAAIKQRSDRYQPTLLGHIELGAGYDNNVNRVSEQTTTVELLPGFPLEVGAQNEPAGDAFATAEGQAELSWPVAPGLNAIGTLSANARGHQDRSEFDRERARLDAGVRYRTGAHRWTATVGGQRIYVGGDAFLGSGRINGSYNYRLDQTAAVHGSLSATQLRYDDQEQRDATRTLVGGGVSKSWSAWWNPRARGTLLLGKESADKNTKAARSQAERDIGRLDGRVNLTPAANWTLRTTLAIEASRYDTAGPIVPPEAREEETYTLDLALDWQPTANWRMGPYVTHAQRDSNVAIYEYDRTAGGVRVRYSFY